MVSLSLGYYHEQPEDGAFDALLLGPIGCSAGTAPPWWSLPATTPPAGRSIPRRSRRTPAARSRTTRPSCRSRAVGALNPDGTIALFSNDGPWVRFLRPGAALVSTMPTTYDALAGADERGRSTRAASGARRSTRTTSAAGFGVWSGTSFAAPVFAGEVAAALLDARYHDGDDDASDARTAVRDAARRDPGRASRHRRRRADDRVHARAASTLVARAAAGVRGATRRGDRVRLRRARRDGDPAAVAHRAAAPGSTRRPPRTSSRRCGCSLLRSADNGARPADDREVAADLDPSRGVAGSRSASAPTPAAPRRRLRRRQRGGALDIPCTERTRPEERRPRATTASDCCGTHVQALPERCRQLIGVIAFADKPDYARIAESLGMPVGSIGPTRGRCLAKLRGSARRRPRTGKDSCHDRRRLPGRRRRRSSRRGAGRWTTPTRRCSPRSPQLLRRRSTRCPRTWSSGCSSPLALDEVYAEVAEMTRDADGRARRARATRRPGTRTETLTFSAERLTAMVTRDPHRRGRLRLDGWIAPPARAGGGADAGRAAPGVQPTRAAGSSSTTCRRGSRS